MLERIYYGIRTCFAYLLSSAVVALLVFFLPQVATASPPITFDFEGVGEFNGSYAATTVNLSGFNWQIGPQALTGTLAGDMKFGDRAARLRLSGGVFGEITMLENKPNGIGRVTFFASRSDFSGDRSGTAPVFELQYSGSAPYTSWETIGQVDLAGVNELTEYTFFVDEPGDTGRIRFIQTGGAAGNRWNLDDITINSAYAVVYNGNGNDSGTVPDDQVKNYDLTLNLETNTGDLEKTGHTLVGWNTAPDGSGTSYPLGGAYTLNEGVELYAEWEINQYTLSFNSNGGTPVDPITDDFGSTITPPTDPTRTGFDFVTWSPALPSTMPATNQTHTAIWSANATSTQATSSTLLSVSNTLTDSAPEAASGHEMAFTIPSDTDIDGTLRVVFPVEFSNVDSLTATDMTMTGVVSHGGVSASGNELLLADVVTFGGTPVTLSIDESIVENPISSGSYEFFITLEAVGGGEVVGQTQVAIIEPVILSAERQTELTFSVVGTGIGSTVHGLLTTGTTTPSSIDFGTLTPGVVSILAHDLTVTTNAANGFVVTVESDTGGELVSATGAVISQFADGTQAAAPVAWSSPLQNILNTATWGHWGITSSDSTLHSIMGGGDFSSGGFVALSGAPRHIFAHTGPADGTTPNAGLVRVGYKVEVTPLQPAALDYSTNLTYIVTPTF